MECHGWDDDSKIVHAAARIGDTWYWIVDYEPRPGQPSIFILVRCHSYPEERIRVTLAQIDGII